jgi:hypothetical protein
VVLNYWTQPLRRNAGLTQGVLSRSQAYSTQTDANRASRFSTPVSSAGMVLTSRSEANNCWDGQTQADKITYAKYAL